MKVKRGLLSTVLLLIIFIAAGCAGAIQGDTDSESNYSSKSEKASSNNQTKDEFKPQIPVPNGLPIYPNAVLFGDIPGGSEGSWSWLYVTTGSGNEIVAFFTNALEEMGFEIDQNSTLAIYEEFYIATTDNVIGIYWLSTEEDETDPDTPNRGYGIKVDMAAWESR